MKKSIDIEAVNELTLYATNNGILYRQSIQPTIRNMQRKIKSGIFEESKAIKAFTYIADYAAKLYTNEFCTKETKYYDVFSKADRTESAKAIYEDCKDEIFENTNNSVTVVTVLPKLQNA